MSQLDMHNPRTVRSEHERFVSRLDLCEFAQVRLELLYVAHIQEISIDHVRSDFYQFNCDCSHTFLYGMSFLN